MLFMRIYGPRDTAIFAEPVPLAHAKLSYSPLLFALTRIAFVAAVCLPSRCNLLIVFVTH